MAMEGMLKTNTMDELFHTLGDIFNPNSNPYFKPRYDNIEDAEIISETKNDADHEKQN